MVKVADLGGASEVILLCFKSNFHTLTVESFAALVWAIASDALRSRTTIVAVFTFFSIV
jgi:hypothetical protein